MQGTRRAGQFLAASSARFRRVPTPGVLARRRFAIMATKLALPLLALGLLGSMAVWPEIQREAEQARAAMHTLGRIQAATMTGARYSSVDQRGRPYTVTAATARQVSANRVDLNDPKGDITLANGTWLMLQARRGVYLRHEDQLDLAHDVTLYRDDGTTMVTASAAIDLKRGAAAGSAPVHAEGPFGKLDAVGGFTATDQGQQMLFSGPAQLVLNATNQP